MFIYYLSSTYYQDDTEHFNFEKSVSQEAVWQPNSLILILKEWALMALINQIDNIKLYSITRMKDSRACASCFAHTVILKTK